MSAISVSYLDRLLEPVAKCFSRDVAQALLDLQIEPSVKSRIEALARKANDGTLSHDEQLEYEDFVEAVDLIGVLRAKASARLRDHAA